MFFMLLAVGPAFLFLGQAMIFEPPAAIFASVVSQVWGIAARGENANLFSIAFFVAHFAVFAFFFWVVSFIVAKLIWRVKQRSIALVLSGLAIFGILLVTQFSVYGSGGHGATRVAPLQEFLRDDKLFGGGFQLSYGVSVAIIGVALIGWTLLQGRIVSEKFSER